MLNILGKCPSVISSHKEQELGFNKCWNLEYKLQRKISFKKCLHQHEEKQFHNYRFQRITYF